MTNKRSALIVACNKYEDQDFKQLVAPAKDSELLGEVLKDPTKGKFDNVKTIFDKRYEDVNQEIDSFFTDREPDDLLLLYFSCHGIKDTATGKLYLAAVNTKRKLYRSTSTSANFINEIMNQSDSRKQILLLDCCYSGAFAKGMVAKADPTVHTGEQFEVDSGRIVLTAADSTQYSFEGDKLKGKGDSSIFTALLVEGIESGKADKDGDGKISHDELFYYVRDRIKQKTHLQTPVMWNFDVQGKIIIAYSTPLRPNKTSSVTTAPQYTVRNVSTDVMLRIRYFSDLLRYSESTLRSFYNLERRFDSGSRLDEASLNFDIRNILRESNGWLMEFSLSPTPPKRHKNPKYDVQEICKRIHDEISRIKIITENLQESISVINLVMNYLHELKAIANSELNDLYSSGDISRPALR